jgi:Fe2+ or Zn2+ uptake regulation protein
MLLQKCKKPGGALGERLTQGGFRFTPQREQVYAVLLEKRDHPTAEEVFMRAKRTMPDISMATVYNCLEALVQCGMAREVLVERGAARFCPNMREHGHFCCQRCHAVLDIEMPLKTGSVLPAGFRPDRFEMTIHGLCPACVDAEKAARPLPE